MDEDRARRLAAIESRLNPARTASADPATPDLGTGTSSGSDTPPSSSSRGPLFAGAGAPPRNLLKAWSRPSVREEGERTRELTRILNRTVIRDNNYAAAAGCVETLVKIATNIQESGEAKFRTLKSDNAALQKKVLSVPGGRDFMILMGFHTERRNFVEYFVIDQTQRRMYELELAANVLRSALPDLQSRVSQKNVSTGAAKAAEAARVEAAKRQIEEDRELVRERVERERYGREARAAAAEQAAAAKAAQLAEGGEDSDDESEEDDSVPGYSRDRRWGYGRKLNADPDEAPEGY